MLDKQVLEHEQVAMRERNGGRRQREFDYAAIAQYRREHPELSQYEVGERMGCSQSTVSWALKLERNPTLLERKEAALNTKLLAVEEEMLADPLRAAHLEVLEAQQATKRKRGRPFKVRNVVCHCGGQHRILPPDPVLEAWYARYKASEPDLS
jgi:transcriptional regulator with XRE-family HTH domain